MESFSGRATVTRGSGLIALLAAWFFRFPKAGDDVPLTITKYRSRAGEIWERNFAGRVFRSYLTPSRRPFHYRERFFAFTYEQELPVREQSLHLPVRRGWFLGIPLPAFLLPASESREYDVGGLFHFDVGLYAPLQGGLVVRYQGCVTPDCGQTQEMVARLSEDHSSSQTMGVADTKVSRGCNRHTSLPASSDRLLFAHV